MEGTWCEMTPGEAHAAVCVPYLASQRWYAAWLGAFLEGRGEMEARAEAGRVCAMAPRDFARCALAGPGGDILLSVAVEGGSGALKHHGPHRAVVSGHGRWPSVHLGAINAVYGRAPYYEHLRDALSEAYVDVEGKPLHQLCSRLHELQTRLVRMPEIAADMMEMRCRRSGLWERICAEHLPAYNPRLPLLDLLMHLGPDAIFTLSAAFYNG